jgi:hypothetical protein
MEVDIADANDFNQCYVSNLQERIIAQEAFLAKSENVTKSKFIYLPIDLSKGKTIHATMVTGKVLPMMIATLMKNTFVNTKLWFPSIPKRLLRVVVLMKAQLFHLAHVDGTIKLLGLFLFLVRTVINLLKSPPRRKQSN